MYKVAIMLVFAVSLGLFADQIKEVLIDPAIQPEIVQLALLDSTINPRQEALNIECTDIAIMSENMTTIQSDQSKAISTVSTCEIKKILRDQPKKLNNKIINEFPVVSF